MIRVMDAVFSGGLSKVPVNGGDRRYCEALGLVTPNDDGLLRPSNRICEEVMSRVITDELQALL